MTQFRLELLDHSKLVRDAVVELRRMEFIRKFGASVSPDGLDWNLTDSESIHFGIWFERALVSTLRLTAVESADRFEDVLLFPATAVFADLPCGVLARAATDHVYAGRGLAMALRVMAYEFWLHSSSARYLYGTALAESKRLGLLREWGYEFSKNEKPWHGYLKSGDKEVVVFRIERTKLAEILPRLKREFSAPKL